MNTIKNITVGLFGLCFFYANNSRGQVNVNAFTNQHTGLSAAGYMPTYLGDGYKKFQLSVFNVYGNLGSNFTNAANVRALVQDEKTSDQKINDAIADLRDKNNFQVGLKVQILNLGLNLGKKGKKPILSLGVGVNERVEANLLFNKEAFLLAYRGNKQFANQTINVAPSINAIAFADYFVSGAANVRIPLTNIVIKPAVSLHYYAGQGNIYTQKQSELSLFTEANGRYLDIRSNYVVNTSLGLDSFTLANDNGDINTDNLKGGAGRGFGMDFAVRIYPIKNLSLNLGLTDVGSMTFDKNTTAIYSDTGFRYTGQTFTFRDEEDKFNVDSFGGILEPQYRYGESYKVKMPTKLLLTANYGMGLVAKKGTSYFKHYLSFIYVQGFNDYLSATKRPWVSVGYNHSFANILNLGVVAGAGGIYRGNLGVNVSLRAGFFRIGLSSNNLLPLLAPKSGRGADLAFTLAFGR